MIKKVCKLRVLWKLTILNVNLRFQRLLHAKYWLQSSSLMFRPRFFVKVLGKPDLSSIWLRRSEIWLKNLQIFTFLKNLNVNLDFQRPLLAKYLWQSSSLMFRPRYFVKVLGKPYCSSIWPCRSKIWLKKFANCVFFENWQFWMLIWTSNGHYLRNIDGKALVWISVLDILSRFQENLTSAQSDQFVVRYD